MNTIQLLLLLHQCLNSLPTKVNITESGIHFESQKLNKKKMKKEEDEQQVEY